MTEVKVSVCKVQFSEEVQGREEEKTWPLTSWVTLECFCQYVFNSEAPRLLIKDDAFSDVTSDRSSFSSDLSFHGGQPVLDTGGFGECQEQEAVRYGQKCDTVGILQESNLD